MRKSVQGQENCKMGIKWIVQDVNLVPGRQKCRLNIMGPRNPLGLGTICPIFRGSQMN